MGLLRQGLAHFNRGQKTGTDRGAGKGGVGDYAKEYGGYMANSYIKEEITRFANKNGMTLTEMNILLTALSFGGNELTGTRYRKETDGVEKIDGLGRRYGWLGGDLASATGFNPYGLFFYFTDIILGYQGHFSASGYEYVSSGNMSAPLIGFSLGALDVNTLVGKGYGLNGATAVSLPFGNVGQGGVNVINGTYDPVNGGYMGYFFSPNAAFVPGGLMCHMTYCYDALQTRGWNP
jgi:hypothetical protein